jgi:flagellar motor switch protein FliM
MAELLTPDEIAALADAFAAVPPPGRGGAAGVVRPIDLANHERALEGRLPGLQLVLERFARGLRPALAAFLGDMPGVVLSTATLARFERLAPRLASPVGLVRFRLTPLRGHGLLVVPPALVASLLQVACGGASGATAAVPAREFSPVEIRLIERLAARVLAELRLAWQPVVSLACTEARVETSPLFARIAAPDELVVHADLAVMIEGQAPIPLALVLPNASLDAVRAELHAARAGDPDAAASDAEWSARLRERLDEVPVEVRVELGRMRLTVARLVALTAGELLSLDSGREGPALVRVAGQPHFEGAPGVSNGFNAVRITRAL